MCLSRNVAGGVLMALLASSWVTNSRGQEPTGDTAAFEVASIRRNADPNAQLGVRPVTSNRFSAVATVKMLVQVAYGFPNTLFEGQIVGGPGWASSDRFEVDAVFSGSISATPGGPPVRLLAMVRALLADRFKLQVRREQRQLAVYDLVLDRPTGALGSRLTRSDGTCPANHVSSRADYRLRPLLRVQTRRPGRDFGEGRHPGEPCRCAGVLAGRATCGARSNGPLGTIRLRPGLHRWNRWRRAGGSIGLHSAQRAAGPGLAPGHRARRRAGDRQRRAANPKLNRWNSHIKCGVPTGIRTRVSALKGPRPRPLDDGDV